MQLLGGHRDISTICCPPTHTSGVRQGQGRGSDVHPTSDIVRLGGTVNHTLSERLSNYQRSRAKTERLEALHLRRMRSSRVSRASRISRGSRLSKSVLATARNSAEGRVLWGGGNMFPRVKPTPSAADRVKRMVATVKITQAAAWKQTTKKRPLYGLGPKAIERAKKALLVPADSRSEEQVCAY